MRSKTDREKPLVPRLRFPEFREAGEWEVRRLGEICEINNGNSNAQDHVDAGKYPLFDRSITVKRSNTYLFDCEAVIIPGEGSEFPPRYYKGKFDLHQRAYALTQFNAEGKFVFFLVDQRKAQLAGQAVKTTVLSLRMPILENFRITIPSKSEQQKIANCLSSLDEVIDLEARKLDALKTHKKGLMQQLFPAEGETTPRLRFPEFREAGAWEFISLEGVAPLIHDRVQLKDISNVNYVSTENMLPNFGGVTVANKLPTVNSVSSFQVGDVLLANIRPYLKKVWAANFSGGVSNDVLVFRPRNSQNGQYVAHILKNDRFIEYVMAGAKGVKMPRGDINSIKEYPVPIPPETKEQQKIANCLSSLDEWIGLESHKLDALKNLKKGLMQQLFPQEVA